MPQRESDRRGAAPQLVGTPISKPNVRDLEGDDAVDLLAVGCEHGIERLRLCHGARETVEDEALAALRL